ncbi:MAG TPA: ATP synthase F1 subunit delta [Candidatus Fimousia stercorigallinarum]|nr:ATP synthase F1 subunit delta [Candidatus Fimousia stercorigallinarum]
MAKRVSKVYGDALFELALEKGELSQIKEEVLALQKIFKENEAFLPLLNHPNLPGEEKIRMMEKIFRGRVSDDMTGFLTIIIQKGRYRDILAIFQYVEERIKKHEKVGAARIAAPMELTDAQKKAIVKKLLETTSYESFEVEYIIDESLIGGLVIHVDDKVVDSSIKTKLANMVKALNQISIS